MRLLLTLIGAAALAAIGWVFWRATADTREWKELLSWAGKDLHRLDEKDRVRVEQLLVKRVPLDTSSRMSPWKILVLEGSEQSRKVLVVSASQAIVIPGSFKLQ